MSATLSLGAEHATWRPAANPWLIAVTVSLAAFMEVLDTAIANVALPHIAGNLGASNDESTWVLTSYLVANAIVLPITGWLVSLFGRKRFFMTCMVIFTVSSLFCGIAPSLGFLLLFRVLQGAGGGGLAPSEQSILADTFQPEYFGMAFASWGVGVVVVGRGFGETVRADDPTVHIPLLANRNLSSSMVLQFVVGFILTSTTVLLPQFVQQLLGYNATQAGLILMPGGLTLMLVMPIAGRLVSQVPA